MARQLDAGDLFPDFTVNTVDGRTLKIPRDFSGKYAALLFYRGGW